MFSIRGSPFPFGDYHTEMGRETRIFPYGESPFPNRVCFHLGINIYTLCPRKSKKGQPIELKKVGSAWGEYAFWFLNTLNSIICLTFDVHFNLLFTVLLSIMYFISKNFWFSIHVDSCTSVTGVRFSFAGAMWMFANGAVFNTEGVP